MKFIRKNLKGITAVFVLIIVMIVFLIYHSLRKQENQIEEVSEPIFQEETKESEEPIDILAVDVKGAVMNPGVYEVEEGKKVIDVIQLAGGFTDQADTSLVNLAKKITGEMVVIIYTKEEVRKAMAEDSIAKIVDQECICPQIQNDACIYQDKVLESNSNSNPSQNVAKLININTATEEELLNLSGIGESKAKAIVEYRKQNGNFEKIEDIMNVSGIGESLYEKIKDFITV